MSGAAWRNLALAASLLFNVFVIGVLVGGKAAGARLAGPWARDAGEPVFLARDFSPRHFVMALPEERRREVARYAMREGRDAMPMIREAREAGAQALAALSAEDFDPEAALAALNAAREAQARVERRGHEILVTVLADLPDDVRLDALERAKRFNEHDRPGERPMRRHGGPGER
jgi:uncharacterized membrane protein